MSPASYRAAPPRVGSRQPYVTSWTKPNRDKRDAVFIDQPALRSMLGHCGLSVWSGQRTDWSLHRAAGVHGFLLTGGCPLSRRPTNSHVVPKADAAAGLGRLSDRESDPCRRLGRELSRES